MQTSERYLTRSPLFHARALFAILLSALTLLSGGASWAQFNEIVDSPVESGTGREALRRARGGEPGFDEGMGGGRRGGRQQGDPMAGAPRFSVRRYQAIEGQRIKDAVSGTVLDDPRRIEITEDRLAEFSDDGRTLGDVDANDGLYSKILPENTDQYIGAESNYALYRLITVLKAAQGMDPLDFFNVNVLTTERFSAVPKLREKILEKDDKVHLVDENGNFSGWSDIFLKDYRIERDNPESKFYELYVPQPPSLPAIKPPLAPWLPFVHPDMRISIQELEQQREEEGGAGGGAGGGGRPVGDGYFGDNTEVFF